MNTQDRLCLQVMPGSEPVPYAPNIIKAMREWIADCSWRDIDAEDVESLTEAELVAGIKKHYAGGIKAFLETCKQ